MKAIIVTFPIARDELALIKRATLSRAIGETFLLKQAGNVFIALPILPDVKVTFQYIDPMTRAVIFEINFNVERNENAPGRANFFFPQS